MAILEIEYLFEIQRVRYSADAIVHSLQVDAGLRICDLPFEEVVLAALKEAWTRDPFDRIIVSHAVARKAPLITKDQTILDHCPLAVWDSKR
jgi:PIN domain nuclease of toxin-antitoxin system